MSGFTAFFGKELREIPRTSRLWVLPGILLFLAVTSPIIAELTPLLVEQAAESQPEMTIQMADPTYVDAYRQYLQQLTQIMVVAVIIASAGLVSSEVNRGTAALVLAKPVSRVAFFVAKVLSQSLLLVGTTAVGTVAAGVTTFLLFGEAPVLDLAFAAGLWFCFAWLLVAVSAVLSALIGSHAGAAGAGLGVWVVLIVVSDLGPLEDVSPAALMGRAMQAAEGASVDVAAPLIATIAIGAALLGLGALALERREI